jgi:membrane peptidoglycan carboxypeptidase
MDADLAAQMRALLTEPVGEGGTAPGVRPAVDHSWGKTGTTQNFVDAWFVGSAQGYTSAVWLGYEQPAPLTDIEIGGQYYERVTGGSLPAPIWTDFMARLTAEQ